MAVVIVHRSDPVALIGGAQIVHDLFNILRTRVSTFVAADGGADQALSAGVLPAAVIGDLDSITAPAKQRFGDLLHYIDDPDTTDFEKAVTRIAAPLVLAAGFLGGRLDHTAAVINTIMRLHAYHIILLSADDVCFVAPPGTLALALPRATRIALLPQMAARVTTTGLRWDIADRTMHPAAFISTSNETEEAHVTITTDAPLLITLPLACLDAAIAAVRAQ